MSNPADKSALTDLTVAEIRDGFRAGNFSAREVAEAFNANVAAAKALNAFIVETPEKALEAADAADRAKAAGEPLKPLAGVPIGMKDLFCTEGVQTTAASHMLEGFTPTYESTVSKKLWDAGAGGCSRTVARRGRRQRGHLAAQGFAVDQFIELQGDFRHRYRLALPFGRRL